MNENERDVVERLHTMLRVVLDSLILFARSEGPAQPGSLIDDARTLLRETSRTALAASAEQPGVSGWEALRERILSSAANPDLDGTQAAAAMEHYAAMFRTTPPAETGSIITCPGCNGTGSQDPNITTPDPCGECQGEGVVTAETDGGATPQPVAYLSRHPIGGEIVAIGPECFVPSDQGWMTVYEHPDTTPAASGQAVAQEPLTDDYVQTVPDKCDRIVWRERYLHLPDMQDTSAASVRAEARNAALEEAARAVEQQADNLKMQSRDDMLPLSYALAAAAQSAVIHTCVADIRALQTPHASQENV